MSNESRILYKVSIDYVDGYFLKKLCLKISHFVLILKFCDYFLFMIFIHLFIEFKWFEEFIISPLLRIINKLCEINIFSYYYYVILLLLYLAYILNEAKFLFV